MARKKSRPVSTVPAVAPPASTAIVQEAAVAGVAKPSGLPGNRSLVAEGRHGREEAPFASTPVGRVLTRIFRVFSSLQLAIVLLTLFTLTLIEATLLESWYNAEVAQFLVYRTWWFSLLLFCLGLNILGAALKKMDTKKLAQGS